MTPSTVAPLRPALADGADQALTAVSPGNGESLTEVPSEVTLTFAADVPAGRVRVEIAAPNQAPTAAEVTVDGPLVTAPVPAGGPGGYTVGYQLGALVGETGFTVLEPGQVVPVQAGTTSGALVSIALAAALAAVVVLTVRRWMASR